VGVGIDGELELDAVGARTGWEDEDTADDEEGFREDTKARGPFGGALPVIAVSNDMAATRSLLADKARA
jgi:hypothetical protein